MGLVFIPTLLTPMKKEEVEKIKEEIKKKKNVVLYHIS
jgi:ribosomal protein L10